MITLRDYQARTVAELWQWFAHNPEGNPLAVLPTGAGKSIICAQLVSEAVAFSSSAKIRVLVVTHSKELIEQNHSKLVEMRPDLDVGIYSSGLKRRDTDNQVIFAGIQSIYNKEEIGEFNLMIVDECHKIPRRGDGQYLQLINRLQELNPKMRVIGLTATPYRLACGYLHKGEDRMFHDVATEVTLLELLDRGYLTPVVTKRPALTVDMTGVPKTAGEFNQKKAAERMMTDEVTETALNDVMAKSNGRNSWLLFCSSVPHAIEVSEWLNNIGIRCEVISGETPTKERERIINDFKEGRLMALANCEVLTTGFDAPRTDLIVMLRATESTALYQQMAGRGMRLFDGKTDCLLLDYAGNVERHGCLDDPTVNIPRQSKGTGIAPVKYCDVCDEAVPTATKQCPECGALFPENQVRLEELSSEYAALSTHKKPILKMFEVRSVTFEIHRKEGSPNSIRVDYYGSLEGDSSFNAIFNERIVSEWICVEHEGYAKQKARYWWESNTATDFPLDTEHGVRLLKLYHKRPTHLIADTSGKYNQLIELIGVSNV